MMQYPGYNVQPNQAFSGLKTSIITIAIIGFIIWIACLGASAGLCFEPDGLQSTRFNGFLLVVVNAAYIFFASEILYLVNYGDTFAYDDLRKLRRVTSKLSAAFMIGIGINISCIIHAIEYGFCEKWIYWFWYQQNQYIKGDYNCNSALVAFSCSFSYIWTSIFFICTAIFHSKTHARMNFAGVASAPRNTQLPATVHPMRTPGMAQQLMTPAVANPREIVTGTDWLPNMHPQSRHSYAPPDRNGPPVPTRNRDY